MNEINLSTVIGDTFPEERKKLSSACILKPVCEHQAPEHRDPVTEKYWKWFYNC